MDTIQQAVNLHDQYQLEFKLDYALSETKKTHYHISTFIFIPFSLGVNATTYQRGDFYSDVQNYIRLKTPAFDLKDFTKNTNSPILVVEKIVAVEDWTQKPLCRERLVENFKLLGAMVKTSIRDHLDLIQQRIAQATPEMDIQLIIQGLVESFLVETARLTDRYRQLYDVFNLPTVDKRIFIAYQATDESLSILIEEGSIEIFQIVDTHLPQKDHNFQLALSERVEAETAYRKAHGYPSIIHVDGDNETYAFRASALKKYASSILYLSTDTHREGDTLEQILFAVAAGLSMILATIIAFYFQSVYGNFTLPLFVALVIGYMLKDRFKDTAKRLFAKHLEERLHDRRTIIKTLDGKHILGIMKEKITFIEESDLPQDAIRARNRESSTLFGDDSRREKIMHHTKEIILYNDAFKDAFAYLPTLTGINDISRYDIRHYLRKMDVPIQERFYLQGGVLQPATYNKIYHLNLITRYRSLQPKRPKRYHRIRAVLTQVGIKRLEQVLLYH